MISPMGFMQILNSMGAGRIPVEHCGIHAVRSSSSPTLPPPRIGQSNNSLPKHGAFSTSPASLSRRMSVDGIKNCLQVHDN